MNLEKVTSEKLWFASALLLAGVIRFTALGNNPLSEAEAYAANQALSAVQGGQTVLGAQPGYAVLTGATFFLTGASEFWARFWPAVAGTALVILAYLGRDRIGSKAALILAFGLALEPSLVAASRQADGRMLAIFAVAAALVFWLRGKPALAGAAGGLALLGGPFAWGGLLATCLGWATAWRTKIKVEAAPEEQPTSLPWRTALAWMAAAVVLIGTLFFFIPGGLSAVGNSLNVYLQGWTVGGGDSLQMIWVAWVFLSPLAFGFGIAGLFRILGKRDQIDQLVSTWWVFTFVLLVIFPARQTPDLSWAAVPFLVIGARQAARLAWPVENRVPVLAFAALSGALFISEWLNINVMAASILPEDQKLRLAGMLGILFLMLSSLALMTWGWSWKTAWTGFLFGLIMPLVLYSFSTAWSSAGIGSNPELELWVRGSYPVGTSLFHKVTGEVSEWQTGRKDTLDLAVKDVDRPSLRWALRDHHNVTFVTQLSTDAQPSTVVTSLNQGKSLGVNVAYTGQALPWTQAVDWAMFEPSDWTHWLLFREIPNRQNLVFQQAVILWVKSDLFPGANSAGPKK